MLLSCCLLTSHQSILNAAARMVLLIGQVMSPTCSKLSNRFAWLLGESQSPYNGLQAWRDLASPPPVCLSHSWSLSARHTGLFDVSGTYHACSHLSLCTGLSLIPELSPLAMHRANSLSSSRSVLRCHLLRLMNHPTWHSITLCPHICHTWHFTTCHIISFIYFGSGIFCSFLFFSFLLRSRRMSGYFSFWPLSPP